MEDRVVELRSRWTPESTSVVCAAAGIATFGMLIASVTKKIMYR